MKKLFAIVLAVVMVLGVASSAMAAWEAGTPGTSKTLEDRYTLEIIKFTKQTGSIASYSYIADGAATAVNGADVYWAIRLTVKDAEAVADADDVQKNLEFNFALKGLQAARNIGAGVPADELLTYTIPNTEMVKLQKGVYYLDFNNTAATAHPEFTVATLFPANNVNGPIYESRCLDTDVAEVSAKLTSKRPLNAVVAALTVPAVPAELLTAAVDFTWEGYSVFYQPQTSLLNGFIAFAKGVNAAAEPDNYTIFALNTGNAKVTGTTTKAAAGNPFEGILLDKLGIAAADLDGGKIYMTADNLRAKFGWNYKLAPAAITWKANSTPIILDPTVGIPKTGENASVIGFAMIMVAVVAAAVAVRKVNA